MRPRRLTNLSANASVRRSHNIGPECAAGFRRSVALLLLPVSTVDIASYPLLQSELHLFAERATQERSGRNEISRLETVSVPTHEEVLQRELPDDPGAKRLSIRQSEENVLLVEML
jgi:hypothetical protein